MRSAVLFLVFNRPDTAGQVFEAIRAAQPPRLYVAADGPRPDREGEAERCAETRRISTRVDWPCEVKTLFSEKNLGCKLGPVAGINWFFENEEEGIILEDDIFPLPSFFDYCDELLERYRHDERVGQITGCNLITRYFKPESSYFFSHYGHIWSWASWRRAWSHYDVNIKAWPAWRDGGGLKAIAGDNRVFELYWRDVFDRAFDADVDWWDYQWIFTCWYNGMICVLPAHNQIENIGFGAAATHTTGSMPKYLRESAPKLLEFPLQHPSIIARSAAADTIIDAKLFSLTKGAAIKKMIKLLPFMAVIISRIRYIFGI